MAKKKYKSTFWNYSNPWVQRIIFVSAIVVPYILYFAFYSIPYIMVNMHPVKVKAVIVDKCHAGGGRSVSLRYYYYEYWYNGTLYRGKFETVSNRLYGEIGDTITIRCNKNRPSQSVFNLNDPPNKSQQKILGWKEDGIYYRSEKYCD